MRRRGETETKCVPGIYRQLVADPPLAPGYRSVRDGLRAGKPVVLNAIVLPPILERHVELGLEGFDKVRVDPDDTITIVELQKPNWWWWGPDEDEP
jgi:hypothetical protein